MHRISAAFVRQPPSGASVWGLTIDTLAPTSGSGSDVGAMIRLLLRMDGSRPARAFAGLCAENGELLESDAGTRRTGQRQDLNILEACLSAPFGEVAAGEVEGVAELDQHVERHH